MSSSATGATILVNADDFGLHRDIDRGILDCVERGRVQSVSFSPIGRSIDWNKLAELRREGVRIGVHITVVGEPWATDGRVFKNWKELAKRLLFSPKEIRGPLAAEIRRQFQLSVENGIAAGLLAHADSHQHVHLMGAIWPLFLQAARENGVQRIRVPWSPSLGLAKKTLAGYALQTIAKRRRADFPGALACIGVAHAGRNTLAVLSDEVTRAAQADCRQIELVAHPGVNTPALESTYRDWNFNWTGERDALLSREFGDAVGEAGYRFVQKK